MKAKVIPLTPERAIVLLEIWRLEVVEGKGGKVTASTLRENLNSIKSSTLKTILKVLKDGKYINGKPYPGGKKPGKQGRIPDGYWLGQYMISCPQTAKILIELQAAPLEDGLGVDRQSFEERMDFLLGTMPEEDFVRNRIDILIKAKYIRLAPNLPQLIRVSEKVPLQEPYLQLLATSQAPSRQIPLKPRNKPITA